MTLPKLDRNAYEEQLRAEFERALREVADAVDGAPQGRVIRDSEEKARDALGTGPFFGERTCLAKRRWAENMDLSPSCQDFTVFLHRNEPFAL